MENVSLGKRVLNLQLLLLGVLILASKICLCLGRTACFTCLTQIVTSLWPWCEKGWLLADMLLFQVTLVTAKFLFGVLAQVGKVNYNLQLPSGSKLHPVFQSVMPYKASFLLTMFCLLPILMGSYKSSLLIYWIYER